MARYRKIDVRIWSDEKFRRLTPIPPCGQGLFLYLLTNPETTSFPGLFRCGEAAMAEALGWDMKAFREAFQEAFREGLVKADWKARVVWVPNVIKYTKPESPNVIKFWSVLFDEVPDCNLKNEAFHRVKEFVEGLGEGFQKAFREAFGKGLPKGYAESVAVAVEVAVEVKETPFVPTADAVGLVELLKSKILTNNPNAKIPDKTDQWLKVADLILRVDKRPPGDVRRVIEWCQADDFWKCNILSMGKLRTQYDKLWMRMKFDGTGSNGVNKSQFGAAIATPGKYDNVSISVDDISGN